MEPPGQEGWHVHAAAPVESSSFNQSNSQEHGLVFALDLCYSPALADDTVALLVSCAGRDQKPQSGLKQQNGFSPVWSPGVGNPGGVRAALHPDALGGVPPASSSFWGPQAFLSFCDIIQSVPQPCSGVSLSLIFL